MRALAFDLSWNNETGWAVWEDGSDGYLLCPFILYGEFTPGGKNTQETAWSLYENLSRTILHPTPYDIVAFEQTDWHRNLSRSPSPKRDYAIERRVQRCLGRAEGVAALAVNSWPTVSSLQSNAKVVFIGANEAKKEFGAMKKSTCARLLAEEYPNRFEFQDKKSSFLFDKILKQDISHHISDAMVIAQVVARREILNVLAEN